MARPTTAQATELEESETDALAAHAALDALRVLLLRTLRHPNDIREALHIKHALTGIHTRAVARRQRLGATLETKDHPHDAFSNQRNP